MQKLIILFICIFLSTSVLAQGRRVTDSKSSTTKPAEQKADDKKKATQTNTVKTNTTETSATKSEGGEETKAVKKTGGKPFLNPRGEIMKMSTVVEFGASPSDADITIINIYGHMGLNFDIARHFHIGPYFRYNIGSTHQYQVLSYRNIDYDVSSLKDWGTGLSVGAYFPIGSFLLIHPELRGGYNEFTIQHPQYSSTTTNFIYRNYLNLTPKMNFGFKLSEYTIFNVHGGYTLAFLINDAEKVPHYDPTTFHYGVGMRFYLSK